MTIEEVGVASGGLGTSAAFSGGGNFAFSPSLLGSTSFTSAGSNDGAILMGTAQGDLAFTPGFVFAGLQVSPNTLKATPSATIISGQLLLDLSGWGASVTPQFGYFSLPPDVGTLLTSLAVKDATHYFYTADWRHQFTEVDDPTGTLVGLRTFWHLEGVATIPEPGTLWLTGVAVAGLIWARSAKRR